ncbi:Tn3-like element TnAs1 family transposase [soil metagenome]
MPGKVVSDEEAEQLSSWPPEVARSDLVAHFTLSAEDRRWVRSHRGAAERIGLAVQLCGLGYLGFVPADLAGTPREVVAFVAKQVGVAAGTFARYAREVNGRSRRRHVAAVVEQAGWRLCGPGEWKVLGDWLTARALEHDTPSVLFRQALQQLLADRVVRPGVDRLMRAVSTARVTAQEEIRRRLDPELTPERCDQLDALVVTDAELGVARLVWLNDGATSASSEWVKLEAAKLAYLEGLGAHRLDLSAIPPERLRQLAMLARRSTPRALRQRAPERRHPILLAALAAAHTEIVDEIVRLFDMVLANTDGNARDQVDARQAEAVRADVGRLALLDDILDVVLDADLDDAAVGAGVRGLGSERLTAAARTDDERLPRDGGHLELMEARFSHVRSFAPQVLGALSFAASVSPSEVLDAVVLLQAMNAGGRRHVPDDAPVEFVPARWRHYLDAARAAGDQNRYKHYWELCVLFALRGGLRSGEIWVRGSRRYADPASYLIAIETWPARRAEVMELTKMPATFAERLTAIDAEMSRYLDDLEALLGDPDSPVSVDAGGQLHLKALTAEVIDPEVLAQRDAVVARLPRVPLTELLIEVDRETGFSAHLTHAGGASPRHSELDHRRNLYAAILSLACNFGSTRMAELTGISADTIDWTIRWYLREDTLRAANAAIVNAHYRHPLAAAQGGGTLSSSDGLRMPMRGKSLTGRALSRYFIHEGLTSYTHISDQYSTYGTQIIVSTERDATFTLDEILGNTTELPIIEHTTDTHGQTLATFALFDLTGYRLSPRIAKVAESPLWRPHPPSYYQRWPLAGPLLEHHAQIDVIAEHWDDLVRIGGSLKLGYVSAALLIAKLQAGSRQHPLAKAMLEYGKLLRTLHALRWFTDEAFRRRIGRQLNRGEATNDLRRFIFFANRGAVRSPHHDDQTTQAHCHTLVVNACVLSTTGYLEDAIDAEEADGHEVTDEAKAHLSFAHFETINPYGTMVFDIAGVLKRSRRPLRRP